MKPNAEQSAFAVNCMDRGLTKREIFAMAAMQAMLPYAIEKAIYEPFKTIAIDAVRAADALIEELNESPSAEEGLLTEINGYGSRDHR